MNLDYFLEYEDDYKDFSFRYPEGQRLKTRKIKNLDEIYRLLIGVIESTKIDTIAFSQGGDHIGGVTTYSRNHLKRKAMNSFIFKVNKNKEKDIIFLGRMNDDVNTYLQYGKLGKLFFQISPLMLVQMQTQKNKGGNTESYLKYGTYVKSFYSVMIAPSCCNISVIGQNNFRIHHKINWKHAVPVILREKHKK